MAYLLSNHDCLIMLTILRSKLASEMNSGLPLDTKTFFTLEAFRVNRSVTAEKSNILCCGEKLNGLAFSFDLQ